MCYLGKANDVDKALETWTSLQEENIEPSPEFLRMLASFLKKNDKPVPFVIPDDIEPIVKSAENSQTVSQGTPVSSQPNENSKYREFRRCLSENDLEKALSVKQRLVVSTSAGFLIYKADMKVIKLDIDLFRLESSGTSIPFRELTELISKLLRAERVGEATRITEEMLRDGKFPSFPVLRALFGRLTSAGDVDVLHRLEDSLSDVYFFYLSFPYWQ